MCRRASTWFRGVQNAPLTEAHGKGAARSQGNFELEVLWLSIKHNGAMLVRYFTHTGGETTVAWCHRCLQGKPCGAWKWLWVKSCLIILETG